MNKLRGCSLTLKRPSGFTRMCLKAVLKCFTALFSAGCLQAASVCRGLLQYRDSHAVKYLSANKETSSTMMLFLGSSYWLGQQLCQI